MTQSAVANLAADRARVLRRYFALMLPGNLVWEAAHLPLYTLWRTGTLGEQVLAVVHCTAGDLLISAVSLLCAILVAGDARWPGARFARVAEVALAVGVGYTVFSEWLNTAVRGSWAYTNAMPVIPPFGTGLTPLLQWIVVPSVSFWFAHRALRARPVQD